VVLAKTIKGWTLGSAVEGRNATHQIKKLDLAQLTSLRRRFHLEDDIPEGTLRRRPRAALPPAPARQPGDTYLRAGAPPWAARSRPAGRGAHAAGAARPVDVFAELETGSGTQAVSTTSAFTRLLRA
jgi:pyruvate dehydrogenase E1 component